MRASKVMQDRVINTSNITVYWNSETDEILGDKKVEAVRIKNNQTGEKQEIPVSAFFVAIGHEPNSVIFKGLIDMFEPGLWPIGPVKDRFVVLHPEVLSPIPQ